VLAAAKTGLILSLRQIGRGTNTKGRAVREKRGSCAPRAISATLNWGKHRLAQEPGLFRDVLLHAGI
jgi:hypothetical protein